VTRALLVVDDDPDVLEILRLCLSGLNVTTAGGGAAAIELVRVAGLDGVLLDVDMPGIDGRAVLHAVRAERPDLPVVFLTANTDAGLAAELHELGALAVLHKPFNPRRIGADVAGAFGWAA
jgi:CheY-like chemotaxis protein